MQAIGELKPNLGDEVTFPAERYGGSTAIIVAIDHRDARFTYVVGWRALPTGCETQLSHGLTGNDPRSLHNCSVAKDYDSYASSVWLSSDVLVTMSSRTHKHMGGMKCAGKHCGVWNDYAAPNQPNGTFLCYSCQQRPACMR